MHYDKSLYIDSLSYSNKGHRILDSIFLNVPEKSIVGLFGRNGSGKSTLLNVIFGNKKPDFAFMRCNGVKFNKGYKTNNISYMPQESLFPHNIKIKDIISFFNEINENIYTNEIIRNNLNNYLSNLSGGESKLIEILIILNVRKSYCLLDEPFSKLSPLSISIVKEQILEAKKSMGILISDHNYRELSSLSEKNYLLFNKSLIEVNDIMDLIDYNYLPNK